MTDDRRYMAHEKEFAENTHGTSQRRGVRGDPWRRELRPIDDPGPIPVVQRTPPRWLPEHPIDEGDLGPAWFILLTFAAGFALGWYIG